MGFNGWRLRNVSFLETHAAKRRFHRWNWGIGEWNVYTFRWSLIFARNFVYIYIYIYMSSLFSKSKLPMRSGDIESVALVHVDNILSFFQQTTTKNNKKKQKKTKQTKNKQKKNRKEQKRAEMSKNEQKLANMSNKEPGAQYINMYCEQKWAKKSKKEQKWAKKSKKEQKRAKMSKNEQKWVKKSKKRAKKSKNEQKQIVFSFFVMFCHFKTPCSSKFLLIWWAA